jgi:hypothetical protein
MHLQEGRSASSSSRAEVVAHSGARGGGDEGAIEVGLCEIDGVIDGELVVVEHIEPV